MGYTVLYIAFGVVALWLLGEVLLQYKARLRWRLLAFAGFCGVVVGVALPSVIVICLGAAAFGTGQTFVTLSYRRGFAAGWALGGRPSSSRRRKGGRGTGSSAPADVPAAPEQPPAEPEPAPEAAEFEPYGTGTGTEEYAQVYSPMPMPDDTGEYAAYQSQPTGGYQGYGWQQQPSYEYEQDVFGNAAYGYGQQQPYPQYEQYAYPAQDPYATAQYGYETPPGGVWNPEYHPEQAHIPQQAPPTHDQPQPTDPYDPYHY
ncbi:hypothetical protein ACFOSC_20820 [Streptantibioticus rubrisoli]|uniref:Uncharacterized protein n=1 Tax=Streptantibioticus rubrisoli TaxID=1387313 RepID=A0ABT1PLJ9_9ACTN|nr:hypothetical protein [Streptantibioticus rubrisoli]MCQ4045691.1 hypothetical protein [Streptantibioticus rubrisoli]